MGGVIVGYEMARALGVEAMFVERPEGAFESRRGFRLEPGQQVLMMEDVDTPGLSPREPVKALKAAGGTVFAGACLVDPSNRAADLGVPMLTLFRLPVSHSLPHACPPPLPHPPP